jgi:hypothetical protein
VLPPQDQSAIRDAFLQMHAAHVEAMALKVAGAPERSAAFEDVIGRARALLAALVAALETYIVAPNTGGFAAYWAEEGLRGWQEGV